MNISLTKHYNQYVEKKVRSGRYESRSEVVRAALRLMESVESRQDTMIQTSDLEEKLLEGLKSPRRPLTKAVWEEIRGNARRAQTGRKK